MANDSIPHTKADARSGRPDDDADDLSTCEREPIHIPGSIQPHGAMIAVEDNGVVTFASENIEEFVPVNASMMLGRRLPAVLNDERELERLRELGREGRVDLINPVALPKHGVEMIVHRVNNITVIEFERQKPLPAELHAVASQAALARLQGLTNVEDVVQFAASEVRRITGYGRVMVYRFDQDSHGEVVAEARASGYESYLGLHYPASDIPTQARALYARNPVRVICDASYEPVPILAARGQVLDLSQAQLRSVSPIHREYLANMGVRGSMSISLMVEGRLWGLISCHDKEARYPDFATRITGVLLGRTMGLVLEQLERRRGDTQLREGRGRVMQVTSAVSECGDVLAGIGRDQDNVMELFAADGWAATIDSRLVSGGSAPANEWIWEFVRWIAITHPEGLRTHRLADLYGRLPRSEAAGVLVFPFNSTRGGYVLLFRDERPETLRWAGNPEKATNQVGERLRPRVSFAEWEALVRGQSLPFDANLGAIADELSHELTSLSLRWSSEEGRMRDALFSSITHDLRTPLSAISMGVQMLEGNELLGRRISNSSRRMASLINQMVDFSLLQAGRNLPVTFEETHLSELVTEVVAETELAFPGSRFETQIEQGVVVTCDPGRLAQAVSNLLSNARNHGTTGTPIAVSLSSAGGTSVCLRVENEGSIREEVRSVLFEAFRRRSDSDAVFGMGLGLFIVKAVMEVHGGRVHVDTTPSSTCFALNFPSSGRLESSGD